MDNSQWARIQIITTVVVMIANVLLVALTSIYVYLTRQMVKEVRASRDPNVFVDLEFPGEEARVAIGNFGQSSALGIEFEVKEEVPWQGPGNFSHGLKGLEVIKNGVSYLPSNRVLKYTIGFVEWNKLNERNGSLEIQVKYRNEQGQKLQREYFINLAQYKEILFESYRDPSQEIVKAIRRLDDSQRSRESTRSMFQMMGPGKKDCPVCAESIPAAAKKCSHCGEPVKADEAESQIPNWENLD